jgi:hypothetical protein
MEAQKQAHPAPPPWYPAWLQKIPSVTEINRILQDFNLVFGPETGIPPLLTTDGKRYRAQHHGTNLQIGNRTDSLVLFMKAFQLLELIRFKSPLPIVGASPYEWVRNLCQKGVFFSIREVPLVLDVAAHATGNGVYITTNALDSKGNPIPGAWGNLVYSGASILWLCVILLHECRHTPPGGDKHHDCGRGDTTLQSAGAMAAGYWWTLGCLEHGTELPVDIDTLNGLLFWCKAWICEPINTIHWVQPASAMPVQPGGDALVGPTFRTTDRSVMPVPVSRAPSVLSDEQARRILWSSRRINDLALQQALSQHLRLPWSIINRLLRVQ